jgi:hypothetical protein
MNRLCDLASALPPPSAKVSLESRKSGSARQHRRSHVLLLVLHLVILPECLPGHAAEFQLGLCAVRGPHGLRDINVCAACSARLRGPRRESHLGGTGLGLKFGCNRGCRVRVRL